MLTHVTRPKAITKRKDSSLRGHLSAPEEIPRNGPNLLLCAKANLATISPSTVGLWIFPHGCHPLLWLYRPEKINITHSRDRWVGLGWDGAVLRSLGEHEVQSLWRHLGFSELWGCPSFRGNIKAPPKSVGLLKIESCTCGNEEDSPGKEYLFHPAAHLPS